MSSYQPGGYQRHASSFHDLPPPPPPPEMPPLPRGPPPPMNTSRGGDSWRPPNREQGIIPLNEFTFRNNEMAPQYPQDSDRYRPTHSKDYARRENNRPGSDDRSRFARSRNAAPWNQRGRRNRVATSDRPLLRSIRGETPEQMLGMKDEQNRFLPAGDVSDSGEEQMEESESDQDRDDMISAKSNSANVVVLDMVHKHSPVDYTILEPPAKRRAVGSAPKGSNDNSATPKWSNPDPYTVLPPVDESQRKRKDVVKIIRKARIAADKGSAEHNQVVTNDDFISLGYDDRVAPNDEAPAFSDDRSDMISVVPGAPSGPRHFSHRQNLHRQGSGDIPATLRDHVYVEAPGAGPVQPLTLHAMPEKSTLDRGLPANYNEALGNRKRAYNDEIQGAVRRRKKGPGNSNGSTLDEWLPDRNTDPTPWLVRPNRPTEHAGFRLHKEICDFYEFVRPQKFEQTVREELLDRLQDVVRKQLPDCNIHCFGSFAAGLYLPNADMDLVVISDRFRRYGQKSACQSNTQMHKFGGYLEKSGVAEHGSVEIICHAKVPLVKFVDRVTAIKVDVSFENETGLIANDTFAAWKRQFPAMPILVTLVKQFLMMRGLNEVMNGGIGGFSVTCLVTSLLQNMPRVQTGELVPEQHLGEMLIEFLDFYGNRLDISRTGIIMDPPGYFDKNDHRRPNFRKPNGNVYKADKADRLAIMDPNKPENDVSGGSRNVSLIFDRFSRAHEKILTAMGASNRPSLLDWVLGGDYESFLWQRNHLKKLYSQRWGSPVLESVDLRNRSHDQQRHTSPNISQPDGSGVIKGENNQELDRTELSSSFFTNPVNPSILNTLHESKPKPRKARRVRKPKADKTEKTTQKVTKKENQKLDTQAPEAIKALAVPPNRKEYRNKLRAACLRIRYPNLLAEVGDSLTEKAQKTILARHRLGDHYAAWGPPKLGKRLKKRLKDGVLAGQSQAARGPHFGLSDVSGERLAAVAKIIDGTSNKNPITID